MYCIDDDLGILLRFFYLNNLLMQNFCESDYLLYFQGIIDVIREISDYLLFEIDDFVNGFFINIIDYIGLKGRLFLDLYYRNQKFYLDEVGFRQGREILLEKICCQLKVVIE